jgi:hypothetical protein
VHAHDQCVPHRRPKQAITGSFATSGWVCPSQGRNGRCSGRNQRSQKALP